MVHENHIAGFLVSTAVHLGILTFVLVGMSSINPVIEKKQHVPLKLSMFQPPPEPVIIPEPIPRPVVKPVIEQVKVAEPPPPKPTPVVKPKPRPKPRKPVVHKPRIKPKPVPVVEIASEPIVQVAKIPVQPTIDPDLIERTENEYRTKLQAAIEAHKKYPRRARRLRQQGSVLVAFKVQKDGSIKNLEIASPSDSAILDKSAIDTVQKISGLFPLPEELNRTEWSFSIPINYFLR